MESTKRSTLLTRLLVSAATFCSTAICCSSHFRAFPPPCGAGVTRSDCYRSEPESGCNVRKWVESSIARLGESRVARCTVALARSTESSLVVSIPGTREISGDEQWKLVQIVRSSMQHAPGNINADIGFCCTPGSEGCITIRMDRCVTPLNDVVKRVVALRESSPALRGASFRLSFRLDRVGGNRCADPTVPCYPLPYEHENAAKYNPDGSRYLHSENEPPNPSTHECETDGDCVPGGCGNSCDSLREQSHVGTCEGRPSLRQSYCGCVMSQCRWFEQ